VKQIRSWLKQDRGAQIAEFAAVVPLLVMIIFGTLWFGRAFNIYTTVNHAAHAAAEVAAIYRCATCVSSNPSPDETTIKNNVVAPILAAAHLDPAAADFHINPSQPLDPNSIVLGPVVTMSYPYTFKITSFTCCPPGLQPLTIGLTINASAKVQEEN
jgi:hypothetical protein